MKDGYGIINAMTNREVAALFEQIADMLAIRGDSIHRVLAYRRAGENIRELNQDLKQILSDGKLTDIPGIGSTLADKIKELLTTGKLEFYDRLSLEIPPTLVEMLRLEGIGPKRVKQIYTDLGITTLQELKEAAEKGELKDLPGFGPKSEERIKASILALETFGDDRTPLGVAWPIANEILSRLEALPGVNKVAVGGSLRRKRETIGDIDLMVAAEDSEPIMTHFREMEGVETVLGSGPTKSSVLLLNGLQVDLRVLPSDRWGTLLSYFTGSKNHNVRLRELALKSGYTLNEHAFTALDSGDEILCTTEDEVYATLGLPFIPAVLREDRGEIEAAIDSNLPELVTSRDIISDLHMHSTWSDGSLTILEMARAAQERGFQHIVISDHSASLGIANGLSQDRLRSQADEIKEVGQMLGPDFRILHGTEMEIRADGNLDYPDDVLADLDFVIASLHVGLRQPRDQIMDRLMAALENPHVDMIAHPTGRLLPDRPPADVDMEALLLAAVRTGTIMEINANPQRLDLRDNHVRRAVQLGVKLAINCDAHAAAHFEFLPYGIAVAQRGWAQKSDIVNTWSVEKLITFVSNCI